MFQQRTIESSHAFRPSVILGTRGFFSRATRRFVDWRPTRLRAKAEDTSGEGKVRVCSKNAQVIEPNDKHAGEKGC